MYCFIIILKENQTNKPIQITSLAPELEFVEGWDGCNFFCEYRDNIFFINFINYFSLLTSSVVLNFLAPKVQWVVQGQSMDCFLCEVRPFVPRLGPKPPALPGFSPVLPRLDPTPPGSSPADPDPTL